MTAYTFCVRVSPPLDQASLKQAFPLSKSRWNIQTRHESDKSPTEMPSIHQGLNH